MSKIWRAKYVDVMVTVPQRLWDSWIAEGDLAGEPWSGYESHFWFSGPLPAILPGERVYIVAHGKLRGYAPLVRVELDCRLRLSAHCFVREGGAVAVTLWCDDHPCQIRGFRGWRYRRWSQNDEVAFPDWREP